MKMTNYFCSSDAMRVLFFFLICLTTSGNCKRSRDDYYDYYTDESHEDEQPIFLSRPQTFTVEVGQSVIFPCQVKNQGKHALIIKREKGTKKTEQLLAVGGLKVIHTPRLVIDDSRLTISHVWPRDAGVYVCTFASAPHVILKHHLNVQFSPSISASVPTHHRVPKGSSVELQCQAEGNPTPSIRWSRQEGPLSSGANSVQGTILKLDNVDREEEGSYVCTADNGIGKPSSAVITVAVEYPPEIVTEKSTIRTGEGDHVELVCLVRGKPNPKVSWTKDGAPVKHSVFHTAQAEGQHRHSLAIKMVKEEDFGAYVCVAENTQGQHRAVIQMTGLPRQPHVTSSPTGAESHSYTIAFETDSFYPITEYRLLFRRAQLGLTADKTTDPTDWRDVSRRVTISSPGDKKREAPHVIRHLLEELDVASDYEVVVRVKNKYGWSSDSEIFPFSTRKALAVHQTFGSFFFSSGANECQVDGHKFGFLLAIAVCIQYAL